jgi:hypothetical protein
VQSFVRNKDTIAPLKTDTTRWDKLTISYAGAARVIAMNDSSKRYNLVIDTITHTILMNTYDDTVNKAFYRYSMPAKDVLLLKGYFKRDSLNITLKKYDLNNFRLLNRGFHWINESPYNK